MKKLLSSRHFDRQPATAKIVVSYCRYCFHAAAAFTPEMLKIAENAHCCPERAEALRKKRRV